MIRLESSSSDCPMGLSFKGKSVNQSYILELANTHEGGGIRDESGVAITSH
jgi:hypothetical protein